MSYFHFVEKGFDWWKRLHLRMNGLIIRVIRVKIHCEHKCENIPISSLFYIIDTFMLLFIMMFTTLCVRNFTYNIIWIRFNCALKKYIDCALK